MKGRQETKVLLGEAAEHLVLARLMRLGCVASQAPRAWKADDILIRDGRRLQVKATTQGTRQGWMVGDVLADPERFYALVDYADEASPRIYVVPSGTVRDAVEAADGEYHRLHPNAQQTAMRKIQDPFPFKVTGYPPGWLQQFHDDWGVFRTV